MIYLNSESIVEKFEGTEYLTFTNGYFENIYVESVNSYQTMSLIYI